MILLIALAYFGGVLTILSPCILPVLPFVFARSNQESFWKSGLPVLVGMSLTFALLSAVAVIGGEWVSHASEYGRWFAMVFLGLFGLSMLFPHLAERAFTPLTRLGSKIGSAAGPDEKSGIVGGLLVGISTGLLWAPCAGPILGLVLTGAASQGGAGKSLGLLLAYSLGAATSLGVALFAGKAFFNQMKKFLGIDKVFKKALGAAVLLGVLAIALHLDRTVLVKLSKLETASLENRLLDLVAPSKKPSLAENAEGELPDLTGLKPWINSSALTREDLLGKVVLIDFWTYSCVNCLRTLPYLKAWAEKYKGDGLVVIGVHAPEFAFEKNEANVRAAVKELGIPYPVALDNDFQVWKALENRYWPAHYFIDRRGRVRHHHFGEGEYPESERILRELLTEDGEKLHSKEIVIVGAGVEAAGVEAAGDAVPSISPETYIGYSRASNLVLSSPIVEDRPHDYQLGTELKANEWSIGGKWTVSKEKATLGSPTGKISFRFRARDFHLVLGSLKGASFRVTLDGRPPGQDRGVDVDSEGRGRIREHRLYQLIRQKGEGSLTDHTFEIEFYEPGVEAYAFTFG